MLVFEEAVSHCTVAMELTVQLHTPLSPDFPVNSHFLELEIWELIWFC